MRGSAAPGVRAELAASVDPGAVPAVVLINPNTSTDTTAMMTAIARRTLGPLVRGVTVARGPRMLTDPAALPAAAPEVVAAGRRALASGTCRALLVAAFGDPGLAELRALSLASARGPVPVVGIGEAALLEAAASGRASASRRPRRCWRGPSSSGSPPSASPTASPASA